mmetsp:Transcript_6523/g.14308  ORF Transcript_6523/g.14308 Transcript_6523/m.14308 type:complete len:420 (-) Transcript_6523:26-1285(-)
MAASSSSSSSTSRYRRSSGPSSSSLSRRNAGHGVSVGTSSSSTTHHTINLLAPVVIEFGSSYIRIGLSGEAVPRHIIPTPSQLATLPNSNTLQIETETEWDGILYPLLSNISTDLLLLKNLKARPVIIVEPIVSPTAFRNAICKSLLDWLSAPSVTFVPGAASVALPYGLGLGQGVVVDVGRVEGRVMIVAGENGRPLIDTFRACPCGVEQFAYNFMEIHNTNSSSKTCDISSVEDAILLLEKYFVSGDGELVLPSSGQKIQINGKMVETSLNDTYFDVANPESLLRCLLSVVSSCPIDLRRDVLGNVIFIGGTVEFISNFERRMLKAVADAFGPAGDADTCKKPAFHSLRPLLHNENGGLGVVHPLPFSPSAFAWTAASVMGTTVLPPDQTVTQKVYKDMKQSDSSVADVCFDFLSTV